MKTGRPKKKRLVSREPNTRLFSPRGRIGRPGCNDLKYEEFEALRLADYRGLNQAEAAASMGISQQTFSRILKRARFCLGEALVLGKIIKLYGGAYKIGKQA